MMLNTDNTTTSTDAAALSWGSVWDNLQKMVRSNTADFRDELSKIDKSSMGLVKNFGLGKESVLNFRQSIFEVREGLAALNMTQEQGYTMLQETGKAVGRNIILSKEGQLDLAAAMKVTSKSAAEIVGPLKDVGISANQSGKEMEKIVNSARQIGVNASETTNMVLKNTDKLNMYNFQGGVEGLAKMAAQAVALRIDMSSVMATAEKAFNPEGAIEMAASLQRLGVTQSELLDPLNLMNMAENDPAELQNQIAEMSKDFVRLKKDGTFEIMPGAKRRMREIEKALGMTTGSLAKMALSSAELDDKMKKISFSSSFSEEEKKLIANMAEMGEGGEYMMKIDGKDLNMEDAMAKIQGMSEEDKKKFFESQQPKTMEQLAKEQLTALEKISGVLIETSTRTSSAMMASGTNIGQDYLDAQVAIMSKVYTASADKLFGNADQIKAQFDTNTSILVDAERIQTMSINNFGEAVSVLTKAMALNLQIGGQIASATVGRGGMESYENFFTQSNYAGIRDSLSSLTQTVTSIAEKLKVNIFGNDLIISDKGTIQTYEKDTIMAGTGLNVISDLLKNPITPDMMSKMMSVNQVSAGPQTVLPDKIGIDLNINVTGAPSQVDTNQIVTVLKDQLVIQQIIENMKKVMTNNNLTPNKVS